MTVEMALSNTNARTSCVCPKFKPDNNPNTVKPAVVIGELWIKRNTLSFPLNLRGNVSTKLIDFPLQILSRLGKFMQTGQNLPSCKFFKMTSVHWKTENVSILFHFPLFLMFTTNWSFHFIPGAPSLSDSRVSTFLYASAFIMSFTEVMSPWQLLCWCCITCPCEDFFIWLPNHGF